MFIFVHIAKGVDDAICRKLLEELQRDFEGDLRIIGHMKCPECGNDLPDSSIFCFNCKKDLTQFQLLQREDQTKSRSGGVGCLKIIGIVLIFGLIGKLIDSIVSPKNSKVETPRQETNQNSLRDLDGEVIQNEASNAIPGLEPVDIYLNFEKRGFETTKNFSSSYGNEWWSKQSSNGIEYVVLTYGMTVNSVESVTATAMLDDTEYKEIISAKPFFKYVGSLPFTGNNPQKVSDWLDRNYNKDKSTFKISGIRFTILAPTRFLRELVIERDAP